MKLIDKIMLKLGYVSVELYDERNSEGNFFYEAFKEGYEIIDDLTTGQTDINDGRIEDYLKDYWLENNG